ncbi:MAG: epimerase [Chitinophagales bacterium]
MKIKAIITGATGMVGEGVLLECLQNPKVEKVLLINRRPSGYTHPKLSELVTPNLQHLPEELNPQLSGYNACFFCAGVSSVGMNEADYSKVTYDLTLGFAGTLAPLNPDMTFIYVSGAGTDGTEKGRTMWARVKGKTENDLRKLGFKRAFAFRPGFMKATPGQRYLLPAYKYFAWLAPVLLLFKGIACTLQEVGQAMINAADTGYEKPVLEVRDITALAKRG